MKKNLALIVFFLFTNTCYLFAHPIKTNSASFKLDFTRFIVTHRNADTTISPTADKKQDDQKAVAKALKQAAKKHRSDSIAAAKALSKSHPNKAAPDNLPSVTQNKTDTGKTIFPKDTIALSAKAKLKMQKNAEKEAAKLEKLKKKEAKKNDIFKMSEKDLARFIANKIHIDTSIKDSTAVSQHRKISYLKARPFPLQDPAHLNIRFFHRYWRDIDLQDPKNKSFALHHTELINSLLTAIKHKEITAYSPAAISPQNPTGDAFTVPVPYDQMMIGLSDTAMVDEFDKDGNKIGSKAVANPFTPQKIYGYRIKEDVYYDKTRSRTITRIIGVAPLVKLTLSSGEVVSIQPLCWVKFKDLRNILVTLDIDPTKKTGESMDDVFLQHRFSSTIVQESNPEGLRIKDYKTELTEQQNEAVRLEKKIIKFKKGSWNYTMINEVPPADSQGTKPSAKTKKVVVKPASSN